MKKVTILISLILSACASTPKQELGCETLDSCYSVGDIAVIGNAKLAPKILAAASDGQSEFERLFSKKINPTAIVMGGNISPELADRLSKAGYITQLAWITEDDMKRMITEQLQSQFGDELSVAETAANGKSDAANSNAPKISFKRSNSADGLSVTNIGGMKKGALTHELGHLWFINAFNFGLSTTTEAHGYGGWAPDWLDESAAVLLEDDSLTNVRRAGFQNRRKDEFYSLSQFLSMKHPGFDAAKMMLEELNIDPTDKGDGRRITVFSSKQAAALTGSSQKQDALLFYHQTRGFIDFLIARTNDEKVIADVARFLSTGGDFEGWLSSREALPDTIDDLDVLWSKFLDDR